MPNDGWIKLHRKILESSVCKKSPQVFMVWVWCLLKANHEPAKFPFANEDITLEPGEFITGRKSALQDLPLSPQNYKTALTYLKLTNRLTIKVTNKFSIIRIVNWIQYQKGNDISNQLSNQLANQRLTNDSPATNQPLTTNKKEKNDKNEKKTTLSHLNTKVEQDAVKVLTYLNDKAGTHYRLTANSASMQKIVARMREGISIDAMLDVIDLKCEQWLATDMRKYLRPETLFNKTKFESYFNELHLESQKSPESPQWRPPPVSEVLKRYGI